MKKDFSLYLDATRFAAALLVFLTHFASRDISGGLLWQLKPYSQTAVMVFFVLSGYVIGFVTEAKETNGKIYFISRVARLHSIILPALILTAICDGVGLYFNSEFYFDKPWGYPSGSQALNYILSFFLIQNLWDMNLNPGINAPFWSLTYEWVFYVIYGVYKFGTPRLKWPLIIICILIAGPSIVALFPIWLIGLLVYKAHNNPVKITTLKTYFEAAIGILALVLIAFFSPKIRELDWSIPYVGRKDVLGDYFDALFFSIHLYYARAMAMLLSPALTYFTNLIRWLGGLTFALYLFHRPIIQVFGAVFEKHIGEILYIISALLLVFIIVASLGRYCEDKKFVIKQFLIKKLI